MGHLQTRATSAPSIGDAGRCRERHASEGLPPSEVMFIGLCDEAIGRVECVGEAVVFCQSLDELEDSPSDGSGTGSPRRLQIESSGKSVSSTVGGDDAI